MTISCNHCDAEIEVSYRPGVEPRIWGRPENCHDGAPDECDYPDECPRCGVRIPVTVEDEIREAWEAEQRDNEEAYGAD